MIVRASGAEARKKKEALIAALRALRHPKAICHSQGQLSHPQIIPKAIQ
jgi:hypothetical protein